MCGILGAYPPCETSLLYLAHRGPDTAGILKMPQIVLGHTRLAILDLSERATQPKWSDDGSVALTYNGEVYNYRTLGKNAETSDTIALVEWLARRGPDFDPRVLDGMYAFAAWFPKQDRLVLCRDPAGIKPLYFAVSPDGDNLAFSSEIKGFFGIEWFTARPSCEVSVQREFLQYGHALPRRTHVALRGQSTDMPLVPTLLDGVWQICPGQRVTFSLERAPVSSFTELNTQHLPPLAALAESVKEQSMSDVEVGVQLSGGIDSSLVAWQYAVGNPAVHGFYVSVPFEGLNEDQWAHHAAERLRGLTQFTFHQINATREEVARVLPSVAWHMDEPAIRHPNAIGVYLLGEYVRRQTAVKVLLTGEGADEMFAGYSWHDGQTWGDYDRSRRIFDFGGCELGRQHLAIHRRESVLVSQLSYDRDIYLPPILARQDRMSMAHSLETRVPFLSNRFLMMPAPIVPGKHVLKRRAAEIFGDEFANREKCGFGFPLPWLAEFEPPQGSLDWLAERPTAQTPFQRWALAALGSWSQLYLNGGWREKTQAPPSVKHVAPRLSVSPAPDPGTEQLRQESAVHLKQVLEGQTQPAPARILERDGTWSVGVAAGHVWRLDTTQWLDNEIIQNGLFELESTRWIHQVIKPGMTVLDVGANIGYYALQFSQLAGPTGRVIAFEPSARFNQRLRDHLRRNRCENVTVVDCGLADGAKQLPLFGGGDSATLGWHDDARHPVVQETVALRSLDDWVEENPQSQIHFIKVDIDGAEPLFVRGARRTLSRFRPVLLMEFMQLGLLEFGGDVLGLARQLSELGYLLVSEKTGKAWTSRAEFLREAMNCSHSINVFGLPRNETDEGLRVQQKMFGSAVSAPAERDWIQDFLRLANNPEAPVIFDGGTNRGQILDQLLAALPGASFHAFEPIPALASELRAKYVGHSRGRIEQQALGARQATLPFRVNHYDETSSFLNTSQHYSDRKFLSLAQETSVPVVTLDDYCRERNVRFIHLLKLDLQGYELEALKGAPNMLANTLAVFAEINFVPVYEGQAEFCEVDAYLRSKGFRIFNLYHQSSQSATGQLGAADVLWVNERLVPYVATREPWEADLEKQIAAGTNGNSPRSSGDEDGPSLPTDCSLSDKLTERAYWDNDREAQFTPWVVEGTNFSAVLEKYLPVNPEFTCAEIGAYPGAFLCDLAKRFRYKPVAIEYSEHADHIGQLLRFNGIENFRIIQSDFFNVTGEQFDVVTSFGFVEHFEDYRAVIAKHFELLKPGGYLVMSVPRVNGFQGLLYELVYTPETWEKISTSHNPLIMNLHELRRTVARHASEILLAEYTLGDLVYFSWTDSFIQHDRRWLVRYLNQVQKQTGAKIQSDELYSPFVLIVARKGSSPMLPRLEEAERLAAAALAAIRREDLSGAETDLRECLRRDPEFLETYVVLSDLLTARGDIEAARYVLEAAPKPMPNALDIVKRLGWNCLVRDDRDGARAAFLEGVTWAPRDRDLLDGLAKADALPVSSRELAEVVVENKT